MKTFQAFYEDVNQLRRDLQILDRQSAPKNRMGARRQAASISSADRETEFKQNALDRQNAAKEKAAQIKQQRLDRLERQSQG